MPETQLPVLFPQFNSHCPRACRENSRARLFALNLNTHPSELKSVFCFFPKQVYFVAVLLQLRFRCVRVGVSGRASLALVAVSASLALSLSASPFICVRLLVVLPLWFSIVLHFIHLSPGLVQFLLLSPGPSCCLAVGWAGMGDFGSYVFVALFAGLYTTHLLFRIWALIRLFPHLSSCVSCFCLSLYSPLDVFVTHCIWVLPWCHFPHCLVGCEHSFGVCVAFRWPPVSHATAWYRLAKHGKHSSAPLKSTLAKQLAEARNEI